MFVNRRMLLAAVAALTLCGLARAGSPDAELSEGEVRKVDRENARITLKHGPLNNLDMPGMTMVFRVSDGAMLDALKAGDKVRFRAEQIDGRLTVTKIDSVH